MADALAASLRSLTIPRSLRPGFDAGELANGDASSSNSSWIQHAAPSALSELHALLDKDDDTTLPTAAGAVEEDEIKRRSAIVVAAARLWVPKLNTPEDNGEEGQGRGLHTVLRVDEDGQVAQGGCDEWTTAENVAQAQAVLEHPRLWVGNNDVRLRIAIHLLQHYLRPLFSASITTSASVDPHTGRARHRDPLLTSVPATSGSAFEDRAAALWKGSSPAFDGTGADVTVLGGQDVEFEHGKQARNAAIGCWNVLGWCLIQLGRGGGPASEPGKAVVAAAAARWEQHWPLVLPPLLTLLEDSDPHFRLIGTRLLLTAVLDPVNDEDGETQHGVPASLLIRTNVVPLLMRSLETSYAFITTSGTQAHVLLDAALAAARSLVLLTTAPIQLRMPSQEQGNTETERLGPGMNGTRQTWIAQDGGMARAGQLAAILMDGIFKVWSFPVRTSSSATAGKISLRHDLIRVTFRWLRILVLPPSSSPSRRTESSAEARQQSKISGQALGIASARFLGVICEFVGSWVEREWAGSWALHAPSPQTHQDPSAIPADLGLSQSRQREAGRLIASATAVFAGTSALVKASTLVGQGGNGEADNTLDVPPGVEMWASRVLLASARLWTLLHDAGLTRDRNEAGQAQGPINLETARLRRTLQELWKVYGTAAPTVTEQHRARLLALDSAVFGGLWPQ
ncbi:hypothetical protein OC844_005856 [Tilletia horrida]|nr:hypothetical protein OC844_005856 [Tilletia horrida]